MELSSLRRWGILIHLTDEELELIDYLNVYGSDRYAREGLSALFITKPNQDVFATGYNCLVGSSIVTAYNYLRGFCTVPSYILRNGEVDLEGTVRVDELCGLGLKKIVVGSNFGAGLTRDNELYVWGEGPGMVVKNAACVLFEHFCPNVLCAKCSKVCYTSTKIGGINLNKCDGCDWFPSYHRSFPPPGIPVRRFIMAYGMFVPCLFCGVMCGSLFLEGFCLNYCFSCQALREVGWNEIPSKSTVATRKVKLPDSIQIVDIDCGRRFLILRTSTNNLLIWGSIGFCHYKGYVRNLDNFIMRSVSCGGDHLAVVSSTGELYTCGDNSKGQLGYADDLVDTDPATYITLRKVPMRGFVHKVSCRNTGTTCLMSNGSVMCFGSHIKRMGKKVSLTSRRDNTVTTPVKINGKFSDIKSSPLTNIYCAKTQPLVLRWGSVRGFPRTERLNNNATDCLQVIADHPMIFSSPSEESRQITTRPSYTPVSSVHAELFANSLFSDLTLKLSDGDFPVHSLVLFANSVYFKRILPEFETSGINTLDMSSYNPVAYKSLLKYFYGAKQDEMNLDDLFDMYALAISYEEFSIAVDTFYWLKAAHLNVDNVLRIHVKAKSAGFDELVVECEHFMESPEFKNMLVKLVKQDSEKFLMALQSR